MGKKISFIRREELIQAVIVGVHEYGFANLTVAQIAKDADVSTGSIHYYFGGKEALLEATMRHLLSQLHEAHRARLQSASSAADRLHAVVLANFDETLLTKETCRVWTQFWAFAPYHPGLARLHRINRSRVRSNILHALKDLVPQEHLNATTNAIQGYMDGVWVQVAQSQQDLVLADLTEEAALFLNISINRNKL